MRSSHAFILGTITGAVVVWLWGRTIADAVVDGIRAVEETTDEVFDGGAKSLRRAEEVVEDTKEHVSRVLRAGRKAMRL